MNKMQKQQKELLNPSGVPAGDGFSVPAENMPHERCWMAWPCRRSLWRNRLPYARATFAAVAKAIAVFEPVTMLCNKENLESATAACGSKVEVIAMPLDDSWLRDTGPLFVTDGDGNLAAVHCGFNGWGGKYAPFDKDRDLPRRIAERLGIPRYEMPMVLEGGAVTVDGEGTLITTEECLLNPNRNPGLSRKEIEANLAAYLGVGKVIWLKNGLPGDETDGHVDNIARFVKPGVVMTVADEANVGNIDILRNATDARGRPLEVLLMPKPAPHFDDEGQPMALSYINFYIANEGLVMPSFGDHAEDAEALAATCRAFPWHEVVQVPSLVTAYGGGNIHCITQQQPKP